MTNEGWTKGQEVQPFSAQVPVRVPSARRHGPRLRVRGHVRNVRDATVLPSSRLPLGALVMLVLVSAVVVAERDLPGRVLSAGLNLILSHLAAGVMLALVLLVMGNVLRVNLLGHTLRALLGALTLVARVAVGVLRLALSASRTPKFAPVSRQAQVLTLEDAGGQVCVVLLPVGPERLFVARGDLIEGAGWAASGQTRLVAARNLTTSQTWGPW